MHLLLFVHTTGKCQSKTLSGYLGAAILFSIPSFIERTVRIDIPDTLEVIILLFIFAAEILGEIQAYYVQFPYWDTMLHTLNGFLCAAIGFSLLDILNRDERLAFKLSPVYLAVVNFVQSAYFTRSCRSSWGKRMTMVAAKMTVKAFCKKSRAFSC